MTFDEHKVKRLVELEIKSFISDPPDSERQAGYLSALLWVWDDVIRCGATKDTLAAYALLRRKHKVGQ